MRNKGHTIRFLMLMAVLVLVPAMAFGAGTTQNTTVQNTAQIEYSVNSVTQPVISNTVSFVVDRLVNFTTTGPALATTATLGAVDLLLTYIVNNSGNDTQGFMLNVIPDAANPYEMDNIRVYIDNATTGTQGTFEAEDYLYSYGVGTKAFNLNEDTESYVFVLANTPAGATNGDNLVYWLVANATDSASTALMTNSVGANVLGTVQTVLGEGDGDGAGALDDLYNNEYWNPGTYTIAATNVTFSKIVNSVVWDPINYNNGNQKAIPGAYVRYDVTISNLSGSPAIIANVVDTMPDTVALVPYYDDMSTPATPATSYGGDQILVDCIGGDRTCDTAGPVSFADTDAAVTYTPGSPTSTLLLDLTGILTGGSLNAGELQAGDSVTIRYMVEIQ